MSIVLPNVNGAVCEIENELDISAVCRDSRVGGLMFSSATFVTVLSQQSNVLRNGHHISTKSGLLQVI